MVEAFIFGYAATKLADLLLKELLGDPLIRALDNEILAWADELPPEASLASPDAMFPNHVKDYDLHNRPLLSNLRNTFQDSIVPTTEQWFLALHEQWTFIRQVQDKELQPFFQVPEECAKKHIRALAIRLEVICSTNEDLFRRTAIFLLRDLVQKSGALSTDYEASITNFLETCVGTPQQPVPFGGREIALANLDDWLDDPKQPHRLLLSAPAGRGKSALLGRWTQRLIERGDLNVIYFPISISFETNRALMVFTCLTVRLAALHGQLVQAGPDTSTDVLREKMADYLACPLPGGHRLILILDGIDEAADWEPGPNLFPFSLPESTRVLLSARSRAGDLDASAWLRQLGWNHPGMARDMELPILTLEGLADVLKEMGGSLGSLGDKEDIITELYRLSEGDPLLVRLYVDELWARGESATRLKTEDLHHIQPGLKGYFQRWWDDQRRQWGNQSPLKENAVRNLFEILACALGPLNQSDVLDVAPPDAGLDWAVLEDALRSLKRLVIGDGRNQGYAFSHPRLGEYFASELLNERRREEVTARFVDWGERTLEQLNNEEITPHQASPYIVQYYSTHLKRAKCSVDQFIPLVSDGWRRAWFKVDKGGYSGFVSDVNQIWQLVEHANANAIRDAKLAPYLGDEIHCALFRASVNSMANRFPPQLLSTLVKHSFLKVDQGLNYALRNTNEEGRAAALAELVPELRTPEAVNRVLQLAFSLREERWQVKVLAAMASHSEQILDAVPRIQDGVWRGKLLEALAPYLSEAQLPEACEIAKHIREFWLFKYPRYDALSALAYRYAQLDRIIKAWELIEEISHRHCWVKAIARVIPFEKSNRQAGLLRKALQESDEFDDAIFKAKAFISLVPCLEFFEKSEAQGWLIRIRETVEAYCNDSLKVECLIELARYHPLKQRISILDAASQVLAVIEVDQYNRTIPLRLRLAQEYATLSEIDKAMQWAPRLDDQVALLPFFPPSKRPQLVNACEEKVTKSDINTWLKIIPTLADYLSPEKCRNALEKAWQETLKLDDRDQNWTAISNIVPYVAHFGEYQKAHAIALQLSTARLQSEALKEIAFNVSANHSNFLLEALEATFRISPKGKDCDGRDQLLTVLAPRLAKIGCAHEMLDAIRGIVNRYQRSEAIREALPCLAAFSPQRVLEFYYNITGSFWVSYDDHAIILESIIPHLSRPALDQAVAEVHRLHADRVIIAAATRFASLGDTDTALNESKTIPEGHWCVEALLSVLPYLPLNRQGVILKEAQSVAGQIDSATLKTKALTQIAHHLVGCQQKNILKSATVSAKKSIEEEHFYVPFIADLAEMSPDGERLLSNSLDVLCSRNLLDSNLLQQLIAHLSRPLLEVANEAVMLRVKNDYERDELRAAIVERLAELGWSADALAIVSEMTRREFVARSLSRIGQYLDPLQSGYALEMAFIKFTETYENHWLAKVIAGLAEYLSEEDLEKALKATCAMHNDENDRQRALIALALPLSRMEPNSLYPIWVSILHVLADRTREQLTSDLSALSPVIVTLGGVQALSQSCDNIMDILLRWA